MMPLAREIKSEFVCVALAVCCTLLVAQESDSRPAANSAAGQIAASPPRPAWATLAGSTRGTKYHSVECNVARRILPENLIWFANADDAVSNGYVAARCNDSNCRPPTPTTALPVGPVGGNGLEPPSPTPPAPPAAPDDLMEPAAEPTPPGSGATQPAVGAGVPVDELAKPTKQSKRASTDTSPKPPVAKGAAKSSDRTKSKAKPAASKSTGTTAVGESDAGPSADGATDDQSAAGETSKPSPKSVRRPQTVPIQAPPPNRRRNENAPESDLWQGIAPLQELAARQQWDVWANWSLERWCERWHVTSGGRIDNKAAYAPEIERQLIMRFGEMKQQIDANRERIKQLQKSDGNPGK